ncbi:MAG: DUF4358 domain-containing protein [Oscillospiraceae bacterium]|nr:DUF4358 domain-containing protein [Oscillospiraceae bacterium]
MKKIAVLTLALILVIGCLAGCAKDPAANESKAPDASTAAPVESTAAPAESTAAPAADSLNLEEVYNNLISGCAEDVVLLPAADEELDSFYPGLNDIEFKQKVAYMAPVTGAAFEVVMVEVANPDDVAKVQGIFEARIKEGAEGDYCDPTQNGYWLNEAKVHVLGNYVGMIVLAKDVTGITVPDNVFADAAR